MFCVGSVLADRTVRVKPIDKRLQELGKGHPTVPRIISLKAFGELHCCTNFFFSQEVIKGLMVVT